MAPYLEFFSVKGAGSALPCGSHGQTCLYGRHQLVVFKGLGVLLRLGILSVVSVQCPPAIMKVATQTDNWVSPMAEQSDFGRTVLDRLMQEGQERAKATAITDKAIA